MVGLHQQSMSDDTWNLKPTKEYQVRTGSIFVVSTVKAYYGLQKACRLWLFAVGRSFVELPHPLLKHSEYLILILNQPPHARAVQDICHIKRVKVAHT